MHAKAASVMPRPGGLLAGQQGERPLTFQDFGALEEQRLERKDRHALPSYSEPTMLHPARPLAG